MQDHVSMLKNIVPNVIVIFTTLYVASKDSPLAFFTGVAITLLTAAIILFISGVRKRNGEKNINTSESH